MKKKILVFVLLAFGAGAVNAQLVYNENYRKKLDEEYVSPLFKDRNAYMLVPGNDPSAATSLTVFQYLQGKIAGLIIDNSKIYSPTVRWRMSKPALYLDEVRVDAQTLATININDIGLIKVFRPPFVGAIGNGGGGAIAIYTLRGDEDEN